MAALAAEVLANEQYRFQEVPVQDEVHHARSLGLSVALGGAMGAAIGAATGHMGVWVAAGIAVYIAITIIGGAWKQDRR
jgi:hypothetical protein